jgi:hypothetical protein
MNGKHRKTLNAIFADPAPRTVEWASIESLLVSVGCKTIEGNGSAVRFTLNGIVAYFHQPHPAKEAKSYQVRDAREFLTKIGINHDHDDV